MRWFWASHAVHHSSNSFNLSTAYRLSWTGRISGTLLFFLPLAWLGFPPQAIAAAFPLNLLYQFWIHAEWIPRVGPLEGWLDTPSAHRVHHAADVEYLDANHGGVLRSSSGSRLRVTFGVRAVRASVSGTSSVRRAGRPMGAARRPRRCAHGRGSIRAAGRPRGARVHRSPSRLPQTPRRDKGMRRRST